jgi:cellulose synthase/poly-beta-1,6-N-acetylglucosamine synthase-like glycosyltransferase
LTGLQLRCVPVHEPGLVSARNAALAANCSDILAFCDDDTVAAADWLARVLGHFTGDPAVGGVGGRDRCHDGTSFDDRRRSVVGRVQFCGRTIGNHHLGFGPVREVQFLKGANMSFRADALRGLWFDKRLRGQGAQPGDDFAFSLAVARAGWKLIYDPEAVVDHYAAADRLRSYVVRKDLADPVSFGEGCFNQALTLWGDMGAARRAVYLLWASAIGTSTYPGLAQAIRHRLRGDPAAWRKCRLNLAALRDVAALGLAERSVRPAKLLNTPKAG